CNTTGSRTASRPAILGFCSSPTRTSSSTSRTSHIRSTTSTAERAASISGRSTRTSRPRIRGTATRSASGTATGSSPTRSICCPAHLRLRVHPSAHEFINLPHQSYQINDFDSGTRRIYIGQEHKNLEATHSWYGDTIGFWDGDRLITHTVDLLPGDFTRWAPMTSNQFEAVEVWELKQYPGGIERLEVQVTFYDSFAFVKPVHAVYAFRHATQLEEAGYRVRHWECELSSNAFLDED